MKSAHPVNSACTIFFSVILLINGCGKEHPVVPSDRLPIWPDGEGLEMSAYWEDESVDFQGEAISLREGQWRLLPGEDDELELRWQEAGSAGFRMTAGEPMDLTGFREEGAISMEMAFHEFSESGLSIGVSCGEGCRRSFSLNVPLYDMLDSESGADPAAFQNSTSDDTVIADGQTGEEMEDLPEEASNDDDLLWHRISVPLSCFIREGDDLSEVDVPFLLEAGGTGAVRVRNIEWNRQSDDPIDCPHYSEAAVTPAPLQEYWARSWWMDRYHDKLEEPGRESARLVFLGNSITQGWESEGQEVWEQYYADRDAINLGFSGDRTENVLWRLQKGHVDGLDPELVVLMIGTNNTGHRQDPPESVDLGIGMILDELKSRLQDTRILLLAIFPRGNERDNEMRRLNRLINERIAGYSDHDRVYFMDINSVFLDDDGRLTEEIMPDYLHPNEQGYRLWAEAMEPMIQQLLGD